jgi:IPT/TIG domain
MRSCLLNPKFPLLNVGLATVLILSLCGWTCTAIIGFNSCLGVPPVPQITSLSPKAISAGTESVLTVNGNDFVSQSQILWNGSALQTIFIDSHELQAIITQKTFQQFGGSSGSNILITVSSPAPNLIVGCPIGGSSVGVVLLIN